MGFPENLRRIIPAFGAVKPWLAALGKHF